MHSESVNATILCCFQVRRCYSAGAHSEILQGEKWIFQSQIFITIYTWCCCPMLPHSNGIVFEGIGQGMSPPIARYFGCRGRSRDRPPQARLETAVTTQPPQYTFPKHVVKTSRRISSVSDDPLSTRGKPNWWVRSELNVAPPSPVTLCLALLSAAVLRTDLTTNPLLPMRRKRVGCLLFCDRVYCDSELFDDARWVHFGGCWQPILPDSDCRRRALALVANPMHA